jgi:hypothetical protein
MGSEETESCASAAVGIGNEAETAAAGRRISVGAAGGTLGARGAGGGEPWASGETGSCQEGSVTSFSTDFFFATSREWTTQEKPWAGCPRPPRPRQNTRPAWLPAALAVTTAISKGRR